MNQSITVVKRNLAGEEVIRYTGLILQKSPDVIILEARFNRADMIILDTIFKQGDRFVETYYTARWYNIFEIHDREGDRLKGWYCNIAKPVTMETENRISYVDLALDLWVAPDGAQTILDEDEFAALDMDTETRAGARAALKELQALFFK